MVILLSNVSSRNIDVYLYNVVLRFDVCLPVGYKITNSESQNLSSFCKLRKGLSFSPLRFTPQFLARSQHFGWRILLPSCPSVCPPVCKQLPCEHTPGYNSSSIAIMFGIHLVWVLIKVWIINEPYSTRENGPTGLRKIPL